MRASTVASQQDGSIPTQAFLTVLYMELHVLTVPTLVWVGFPPQSKAICASLATVKMVYL